MASIRGKAGKRTARRPSTHERFRFPKTVSRPELIENSEDHRFRNLIYELGHLSRLLDRARYHLATDLHLTAPQYSIITVVAEFQGERGVSVVDIASHLHVTGSFVTTQVNALIAAGMLQKLRNPDDGRSVLLHLTERAETEVLRVSARIRQFNDHFFASLDRPQFLALCATVSRLIESGEQALAEAPLRRESPTRSRRVHRRVRLPSRR